MPNENYKFIGWSDGYNETNRSDKNVTESKSYTAMFEKIGTLFNLVYNNATENADIPSIRVYYDSIKDAIFPIPQRINSTFEGWYLDKDFTTQVTDKDGKLLDDNLVYDYDIENLYAKFSLIEDVSYKILMVYVTAVKGTFETYHGDFVSIDYKMSEVEKTLCEMITDKFAQTLNEMFAGLVRFEVDSYFTTEIIGAESFTVESSFSHGNFDYSLDAYKIPELNNSELLDNYRSVLTTVPLEMDGEDGINPPYKLHSSYGVSEQKYACLYWECIAGDYITGDTPLVRLFNPTEIYYNSAWDAIMALYAHEFCHTVELQIPNRVLYKLHATLSFYFDDIYRPGFYPASGELDVIKLFLLNQAKDNEGVKYGIPYDFWDDSIKFNDTSWVHYVSIIDRKLIDEHAENLRYEDFLSTTLYIPEIEGYEFEGWFLDQEYTLPIGDKYGNVTEDDYKIFDKEKFGTTVILYGKFSKK